MPLKVYPLDQKGANVRVDYGDVSGAGAVGGGCRGGRPPYLVRMKAAPEAEQGYITRPPCRAGQKGYEMAECEGEDTPESYMMLACLICWLCNPPFGIAALYFSIMSNRASAHYEWVEARRSGRYAMVISTAGIIVTIFCVVVILPIFAVLARRPDIELH